MRVALLACPETGLGLRLSSLVDAERELGGGRLEARPANGNPPVGPTPTVLVREDNACAYPVVYEIPVLLLPEVLLPAGRQRNFELGAPQYAEAYEEMEFYNAVAARHEHLLTDGQLEVLEGSSSSLRTIAAIARTPEAERDSFPSPRHLWIDAVYDTEAQFDAYAHLAPIRQRTVLQIGGGGSHAVKFLLAGASAAVLVGPMVGELRFARALARRYGVEDRLQCVAGLAEELPFRDESFEVIYSGACAHHWVTELAFPECSRVLVDGGRFAAVDPWRAPGYTVGTRLFGKREPDVHCRPLTSTRIEPVFSCFEHVRVIHHGALTRYALIALGKLGLELSVPIASRIQRIDDAICSLVPPMRRAGSIVTLIAWRRTATPASV